MVNTQQMADNLTVVGKIVKALPTYITPNGYEVQQIIIKQSMNKYPNLIAVYVYGDLIDKFGEGADVMLQKEYLNKYPELKKAEVTFSGLLIMQQRDIKEFEKAIIKYEEFKTHFTKEPVKADFELYTQNDKQAQLTIDLKEIVKLFNKLHTNYGLTIHKGTFFQAVPQAFYGFELEPNPQLVLTF